MPVRVLRLLWVPLLWGGLTACSTRATRPEPPPEPEPAARTQRPAKPPPARPAPRGEGRAFVGEGLASFYGPGLHGNLTANGERFDQNAMTAAHPTLPLGTVVRVTNLQNGRTVKVRINDRGPYAHGRVIDLSKAAAAALGFKEQGVTPVAIERLG